MEKLNVIAKQLVDLKPSEAGEILIILEEDYGIKVPETAQPVITPDGIVVEEVQSEFNVTLVSFGEQKMKVIKLVKDMTGLALREAKALVDDSPSLLGENVSKETALDYEKQLTEVGADIRVE